MTRPSAFCWCLLVVIVLSPVYALANAENGGASSTGEGRPPRPVHVDTRPSSPAPNIENCVEGLQLNMRWCLDPAQNFVGVKGDSTVDQPQGRSLIYQGRFCRKASIVRRGYELCQGGQKAASYMSCSEDEHLNAATKIIPENDPRRPATCPNAAPQQFYCKYPDPASHAGYTQCLCNGGLGKCSQLKAGAPCKCDSNNGQVIGPH